MIVGCVVSDRGDTYLPACRDNIAQQVATPMLWHTVDDSDHKLGMAGAVRAGWQWAIEMDADYLFWVEEDFRFLEPVDLDTMVYVLEREPKLAQLVLKRQPWSDEEKQAGGIVEMHPDEYVDCRSMRQAARWCEHRLIFSLNPCLIPRHVLEMGWPDGNEAEFTQMCVDRGLRFAFFGHKFEPPRVEHVGEVRGTGWRL